LTLIIILRDFIQHFRMIANDFSGVLF